MKKSIYLFVLTAGMAISFSCSCTKKNNSQHQESENTVLPDSIYRFTVSFISIGAGTDHNAAEQFKLFMGTCNKEYNVNLKVETFPWGREGEIDYCLKLSELNNQQQVKFIADTKELLKTSELVRYYENRTCGRQ